MVKRALSFKRGEHGHFATLRGEPRVGCAITGKPGRWYWSLGDEERGGLFVDGWAETLAAAKDEAEAAGRSLLAGIHPRYGTPWSYDGHPARFDWSRDTLTPEQDAALESLAKMPMTPEKVRILLAITCGQWPPAA